MFKDKLETKDLILGKAKQEDLQSIYNNYWNSEKTSKFMLWVPQKNLEEAQERLDKTIAFQKDHLAFLIYEKATGEAIGQAAMIEIEEGIWEDGGVGMGEKFVGKGYGKQVLNCFIDYLFSELNAQKIICSCHPDNTPSKKLQQACGMKFTHTQEFTRKKDGVTYNAEYYAITREEWATLREKETAN
ncbi:MAG: GNAT family N-acetyltransferase [Clostridiales bacterium]|nr:GNAT family N-acetyltransferase [Clostridiales bacterium]